MKYRKQVVLKYYQCSSATTDISSKHAVITKLIKRKKHSQLQLYKLLHCQVRQVATNNLDVEVAR